MFFFGVYFEGCFFEVKFKLVVPLYYSSSLKVTDLLQFGFLIENLCLKQYSQFTDG